MRKLSITILTAALAFTTAGALAQSKDKKVQSQKELKKSTSKKSQQIRTEQGVAYNPTGTHGAGATATTKDAKKSKSSKKEGSSKKNKPVKNPGIDSNNGH